MTDDWVLLRVVSLIFLVRQHDMCKVAVAVVLPLQLQVVEERRLLPRTWADFQGLNKNWIARGARRVLILYVPPPHPFSHELAQVSTV